MLRTDVSINTEFIKLLLPGHKADQFLSGRDVILRKLPNGNDPISPFNKYIELRDDAFPLSPELWLREDGSIPTFTWFVRHLKQHTSNDVGGSSLRSGGADYLAIIGTPWDIIQAVGRWSSDAFKRYIRTHPVLIQSMIWGQSTSSQAVSHSTSSLPSHPLNPIINPI